MSQTANISIYLQAVGGHFLGGHAYDPAYIKLTLNYTGGSVAIPYTVNPNFTDDGNVSGSFTTGASSYMPIITTGQATAGGVLINFLSGDFTTASGRLTFNLPAAVEMAELLVSIPTPLGAPFLLKQSVILNPAQSSYQLIIPVPGLYLSPASVTGSFAVFVKMMCGCPVTEGPPGSLWPASDFTVYANVLDTAGNTTSYALTYTTGQAGNSQFSAAVPSTQAGVVSVTYTAFQKSTGNYGVWVDKP